MNNKTNKNNNITVVIFTQYFRIQNVIKWSLISFVGFILGMSTLSLNIYILPLSLFIVTAFCVGSFTFAINNYYDVDSDRENPRRKHINAIVSGRISKKTGILLNTLLVIISLVICLLYKFEVFLFCAFLIFIAWSYSAPPLRLKGRPVLDVILHFFGFFAAVIWGSFIAGYVGLLNWLFAFSLGVFSTVGQVGNHIIDYSFDKASGTKTFAVWIGLEKAKTTINILTLLHLIVLIPLVLLYSLSYIITIIVVIIFPIIGFLILRPKKGAFPTKRCYIYYFSIVIGGAVYLSCIIFHILFVMDIPTVDFFNLLPFLNL